MLSVAHVQVCRKKERKKEKRKVKIFHQSQHVDRLSVLEDGFPFQLSLSLCFDRGAGLQDHFAALGIEEGAELVRAGWFWGVVGLLCGWSFILISMGVFSRAGGHA